MASTPRTRPAWPAAKPLVKWSGGKSGELPAIRAAMPPGISRAIEPFAGGGAFMFALPASVPVEANDRSADLVALYRLMAARDAGLDTATRALDLAWRSVAIPDPRAGDAELAASVTAACAPLAEAFGSRAPPAAGEWAARGLARKRKFLAALGAEATDGTPLLLSAMKAGAYTAVRESYNSGTASGAARAAAFWFLRDFCFGGMFRTNSRGLFNVPYGGVSYNARGMSGRLAQLADPATAARLAAARFSCGDFEEFLDGTDAGPDDFVFLDPPYDSRFSTYDGNSFGRADHLRLSAWMARTRARWMIVISATDFVRDTYCSLPGARVTTDDKLYLASIKNRHSREAVHLLVTNYGRSPDCAAATPQVAWETAPAAG